MVGRVGRCPPAIANTPSIARPVAMSDIRAALDEARDVRGPAGQDVAKTRANMLKGVKAEKFPETFPEKNHLLTGNAF